MQAIEFVDVQDPELLFADLWTFGTAGIEEDGPAIRAFFPDEIDLGPIFARCGGTSWISPEKQDAAFPPSALDPVFAGHRFFIIPPGSPLATPPDRIRLEINAQNAFGSGSHETTRLMIEAMEQVLHTSNVFLDVGCGSGVLSAVALQLGAKRVFACDTLFEAAALTLQHAPGSRIFAGSVDALQGRCADVIAVNITDQVLDRLAPHLHRLAKPDGWLILSGFLGSAPPSRFSPTQVISLGEWQCWLCRADSDQESGDNSPDSSLQPFAAQWW